MNKHGCKPTEDVCMAHEHPLICRHGCQEAADHRCNGYDPLKDAEPGTLRIEPRDYFAELRRGAIDRAFSEDSASGR